MGRLYATQTDRGLSITWTGTDLTGVTGGMLSCVFYNRETGQRFPGTGSFSAIAVTNPGTPNVVSTCTYSPSAADVAANRIGEWQMQLKVVYAGGNVGLSTLGVFNIDPPL